MKVYFLSNKRTNKILYVGITNDSLNGTLNYHKTRGYVKRNQHVIYQNNVEINLIANTQDIDKALSIQEKYIKMFSLNQKVNKNLKKEILKKDKKEEKNKTQKQDSKKLTREEKIEMAKSLIKENPNVTLQEVSYKLGYKSRSGFNGIIKTFGMTWNEWKKSVKSEID